jgi:hypothetical protein
MSRSEGRCPSCNSNVWPIKWPVKSQLCQDVWHEAPASGSRVPEHRCGVRGFADSGEACPGCVAAGRTPPEQP